MSQKISLGNKRKYQKKLEQGLRGREDEIRDALVQEWRLIGRQAKKEEVVRQVEEGALQAGKVLLQLLFVGGLVSIVFVMPGVFVAVDRFSRRRVFFKQKDMKRCMRSLRSTKDIYLRKVGEHEYEARITDRGREKSLKVAFRSLGGVMEQKWDGWWRMVMFDIPEKHKREREGLRLKLEDMGFYRLQKSVYVSPYDCERVVRITMSVFGIEEYAYIIKTKHISCEHGLKKYFNLS